MKIKHKAKNYLCIKKLLVNSFNKVKNGMKNYFNNFKNGDIYYKLSYIFMGVSDIKNKQLHRGLFYLLSQIIYWVFMGVTGIKNLLLFSTLGKHLSEEVWDEELGVYVQTLGDNSLLILLFSIISIVFTIIIFSLYINSLNNAKLNNERRLKGLKPKTFKEEVNEFSDSKFHITITAIPISTITIFVIIPLIFMIFVAFTNYNYVNQPPGNLFTWVGFENFGNLFSKSSSLTKTFISLFIWTMVWAVCATFFNYILGMLLAIIISKKDIKLKPFWRTIFVLTIAIPQFISLLIMSRLLSNSGALNQIIELFGGTPIKFLEDHAKITIIIVNLWVGIPFTMLSTMGILMNIPKDLYEASRIDGATVFQQFRKITLPYMNFIMTPYLITTFIGNINNFNVIYLLTGGGPYNLDFYGSAGDTDLLITWLFKITTSTNFDYGLASTIGIVIFTITATFSLIAFNKSKAMKNEGEFR
ncbi:MAG: sugar ABC transporter permease [bacterium]